MADDFAELNRALDRILGGRPALVCEDCGEASNDAALGWRTYLHRPSDRDLLPGARTPEEFEEY